MDLIRLGPIVQVATSASTIPRDRFETRNTALSLYDLTATARGDILLHQTGYQYPGFSGENHSLTTLPITAFGSNRGTDGTQVWYRSYNNNPIQFDAAEGAAGLLTARADLTIYFPAQTGRNITAQRYSQDFATSNTTPVTGEIVGEQTGPAIAALRTATATNAMIVWTDTAWPGSADAEVIGRIVDSSGNPVGAAFRLTEPATSGGIQERPDVAAMINDRFAVTWISGSEVRARVFDAGGAAASGEILIASTGRQIIASEVIALSGGGFVAIWQDRASGGSDDQVHMRVYDAAGNPLTAAFSPHTGSVQQLRSVTHLGDGGFAILWTDSALGGHFLRVYNADGTSYAGPVQVSGPGELALMADGRLALATETVVTDATTNITTQRLFLQYIDTRRTGVTVNGTGLDDGYVGSPFNDTFNGLAGNDVIAAGEGNDTLNGGNGADSLNGEGGTDTIVAGDGADVVFGGASGDVLLGNEGSDALYGEDTMPGTAAGDDGIDGGSGADLIFGQGGNDVLLGGDGNDGIDGGDGNDTIICGTGGDGVYGGSGNDAVAGQDGADVLLGDGGNDILFGGAGADVAAGGSGNDTLWGDDTDPGTVAGNDALNGGDGDDTILGQGGNDTLLGGNGTDAIAGGDGSDVLYGEAGIDIVFGGAGGDLIIGGAGGDVLKGEGGSDLFVFNAGDNGDLILDFNVGGARDGIDLRGYFDASGFAGTNPRAAGVMAVLQNGADTDVYLHGAFAFRIQGVVAAAIDDSYFLFQ